jgi:hypothetical protein
MKELKSEDRFFIHIQEEEKVSASVWKAVRQEEFSLAERRVNLFVLFRPSTDWMRPTHTRTDNLLYSVYWYKNLDKNTYSRAHPSILAPPCISFSLLHNNITTSSSFEATRTSYHSVSVGQDPGWAWLSGVLFLGSHEVSFREGSTSKLTRVAGRINFIVSIKLRSFVSCGLTTGICPQLLEVIAILCIIGPPPT